MEFLIRDFLEKYYIGIKKENPKVPILVRECSGIQPKMYARYGKNLNKKILLFLYSNDTFAKYADLL